MPRWTEAERATVKAAYLEALVNGIASATVAGQQVTGWTPEQWGKALDRIEADLASTQPHGGMRFVKLIPPAAG